VKAGLRALAFDWMDGLLGLISSPVAENATPLSSPYYILTMAALGVVASGIAVYQLVDDLIKKAKDLKSSIEQVRLMHPR
jgi:hypothetical protein